MILTPGTRLGPYEIVAALGAGGMGEVYRARDPRLGRDVAIKVLPEEFAADRPRLRRFEQEARAASALNHPNIVTIYDIANDGARTYLVMELVDGQTLRQILLKGPLPGDGLLDLGSQIADGLSKAHESAIVHRDLKPENVMVTRDGLVKILDFGLAKFTAPGESGSAVATLTHAGTERGTVLGTVGYMSPEQASGEPADHRSDQFSLGAILYEMATGERAFRRPTPVETLSAIIREQPKPIARIAPAVPEPVRRVVERCLEKSPLRRYGSTRDLARDLKDIRSGAAPSWPAGSAWRSAVGRPRLAVAALAVFAAAVVAAYLVRARGASTAATSLAVLPFTNATGDESLEYLSDGMTESVIHSLAQLPGLRVIAHSSVLRYKGQQTDPLKAGRELGVSTMVLGRVVREPEGVAISAELVSTSDGSRLWGERYETRLGDLAAIHAAQSELSTRISENLRLRLTGSERKRLAKRSTENAEAYALYLKGRYHSYKFTEDGYRQSLAYYQKAIELDPAYALAYSGLADSYSAMAVDGLLPPGEALPRVEAAARRAVEIDDALGEGHASMALARQWKDRDWAGAEREFRRAISLSPSYSEAHHYLAILLRNLGRFDEAIAEMTRAQELDPLQPYNFTNLGGLLFWAQRYDAALQQYKKALELDPNYPGAHDGLADVLEKVGRPGEAQAERERDLVLAGDEEGAAALARDARSVGYAAAMRRQWETRLTATRQIASERYVSPVNFAIIHAALNDKDRAFEWLGKAELEQAPWLQGLKYDPLFESLRSDNRFAATLGRLGLPT